MASPSIYFPFQYSVCKMEMQNCPSRMSWGLQLRKFTWGIVSSHSLWKVKMNYSSTNGYCSIDVSVCVCVCGVWCVGSIVNPTHWTEKQRWRLQGPRVLMLTHMCSLIHTNNTLQSKLNTFQKQCSKFNFPCLVWWCTIQPRSGSLPWLILKMSLKSILNGFLLAMFPCNCQKPTTVLVWYFGLVHCLLLCEFCS